MTVFSLKMRNTQGVNGTNKPSNYQKLKAEQEKKETQGFNQGQNYSPEDKAALLKDFQTFAAAAGIQYGDEKTEETDKTEETNKTDKTDKTRETKNTNGATDKSVEEIKEEKEKLQKEREANMKKMDKLEAEIKQKAEDAKDNITKAAALQEKEVEEHKEETQEVLNEQIAAYIAANKEGGEGMSREQLQQNIKGAMPNAPAAADAVAALTAASEDVNEMDSYLASLNKLIQDTNKIDADIKSLDAAQEAAEQAAEEAAQQAAQRQCCDPIGFTLGEGEDQVRYDFIKDDGNFDTTSDLLGAQDNWAEMQALDTDGDNTVSAEELEAGGIKAVKTDAEGNQSTVSFAEEFGEDFSIDLNSYAEGGAHSAIDTSTGEQELLGTFNLNIGGESVSGYNTLDDIDFLQENYGITNDIDLGETGEIAEEATEAIEYSEDLKPHVNFFETYTEKSKELKKEIADGYSKLGITEEQIEDIDNIAKKEADVKAQAFMQTLDEDDEEQAVEEDKADKTEATEEAAEEQPAVEDESQVDADAVVDEQTADADAELEKLLELEDEQQIAA